MLELITQPDHAALAAEIIEHWQADDFPNRPSRRVVLLAAREHDNGWREADAAPEVDRRTGRPCDFITAPDRVKQPVWPRGVARLEAVEPLAAALVAEHALTVYGRHKAEAGWRRFFETITAERERLLRLAGADAPQQRGEFARDYRMVYLADLLSLIFCNGWTDPMDAGDYRVALLDNLLRVSPDPFAGAAVPLAVRARRIEDRRYESDAVLRAAIDAAAEITVTGRAIGSPE